MVNKKFLILFLALLIVGMSVAVAADVDDSTSAPTKKVTKDTTKVVKNSAVTKQAIKTADNKAVNKAKKTTKVTNKTKDDSKTVKSDVQADETTSINKKLENNINVDDSTVKEDTLNLSKKIIKNVKTDESEVDEGQSYTVTVSGKELVYTVYNNGTLVLHINDAATLSRQVQFEMLADNTRPKLPITVTNLGVNITDVVIDIQAFSTLNTPEGSYRGICAMFEDENVNYSSMNLIIQGNQKSMSTKKVNIVLGNPQLWDGNDRYEGLYKSVTIENMNYVISNLHNEIFIKDNVTLRNCSFTHSGPADPAGSLVSISTVNKDSVNNVLIENCNFKLTMNMAARVVNRESYMFMFEQGYWTEDQLNEMLTAMNDHGIYVQGQNVTMHNNTIDVTTINKNFEEDINNYDYALAVNGEDFTFTNNEFTNQYVRSVYLNGTNAILENNTITSLSDDTAIDITKSGNIVRYNSLSAVDVEGDIAVNTTGDNVVRFNQFTDTELKIISGTTANYNESLPITVILKDKTGMLIGGVDVLVSVGDSPAETFTTDDYGMFTYDFISTTPGNVTFTVKREGNEFFGESEASVEITVGEDKDAIIADLNKTVQEQNQTIASQEEEIDELNEILDEQDTQIETLENTTQALNSTVSQLEKDLTQAQEQLAKNNNTNTNGSSSNNGTSNTNTTTPTKTSVTLKVNPATIYTGSKTKITATLKDANGKAVASQKISIKVGSKTYTVKTNKKGVATKTVKVTKTGKNKVTATFKATSKYAKATKSATLTVKAKEKTKITVTKLAYKNKKITIKATIKAGKKALTQNTKLTVKVDGKTLSSKKVSKKGKISLTFSKALKKGSYKVQIISKATSMYKQAKVTKTLKVNA